MQKGQKPDPNRTQENCSFQGTADVYPEMHNDGYCHADADGYFWPLIGHHHHIKCQTIMFPNRYIRLLLAGFDTTIVLTALNL